MKADETRMRKKRIALCMLALMACVLLAACGKSEAAEMVDSMIYEIGGVSLNSGSAILAAEEAYGRLPDKDKEQVEYLSILMAARTEYDKLAEKEAARVAAEETAAAAKAADEYETAVKQLALALKTIRSDSEFVSKYAGNTNGAGSRRFADSFLEEVQSALDEIDMDAIKLGNEELYSKIIAIQADCDTMVFYLNEMGVSNSDRNVPTMRALAMTIVKDIDRLYANELKGYEE